MYSVRTRQQILDLCKKRNYQIKYNLIVIKRKSIYKTYLAKPFSNSRNSPN